VLVYRLRIIALSSLIGMVTMPVLKVKRQLPHEKAAAVRRGKGIRAR
jgi:hypothetical protein